MILRRGTVQGQTDKNLDYKTDHENTKEKKKKKSSKVKLEIRPK